MHALLVLVQISDGEEGLGEVNVVQVEVFQDPPDQAMLNDLPNLMEKCFPLIKRQERCESPVRRQKFASLIL